MPVFFSVQEVFEAWPNLVCAINHKDLLSGSCRIKRDFKWTLSTPSETPERRDADGFFVLIQWMAERRHKHAGYE